ncbi:Glycosyl transferase, group 1 [hydrothermal vent metagenome]|uniref:Glycosyl transferase, group 1 n=1 Tax=hydrothermal vent metagenome TaxID=652676 RepID=A0A3B0ZC56_9ZZZZ
MYKKIKRKIQSFVKSRTSIHAKVVEIKSSQPTSKGRVLLSYVIDPFLCKAGEAISHDHTHHWESYQIAETFLSLGYDVDVISYLNNCFRPSCRYDYFVAARTNFQRISQLLNPDCIKVAHLDTAHWIVNNAAAYQRMLDVKNRKGVSVSSAKLVEKNQAIEYADLATILGNQFTIDSYKYASVPIYRIPISVPQTYPWVESKNFDACRNNYMWFGSSGLVHKGLDLVLEAFAEMPEYNLTVCGPIEKDKEFSAAYHKELYETSNITTADWIDIKGKAFRDLAENTLGLVYPTCAEGGGGSVISCMHAGIVPVLSVEASVDIKDFGTLLSENSIEQIKCAIRELSSQREEFLRDSARKAWEYAREHHTQTRFTEEYAAFVKNILLAYTKKANAS